MPRLRVARTAERLRPLDLRRAVAACRMRNLAIQLNELGVIDIGAKTRLDGFQVSPMSIARNLNAIREPLRKVTHELDRGRAAAIADAPGRHQLRIRVECNPGPEIASFFWGVLGERNLALFAV